MTSAVEVSAQRLRERGERVTPARLAVVEVLAGTEEHLMAPAVDWIATNCNVQMDS